MTTNDDQYVPSEALLRTAWSDYCQSMDACNAWVRPDGIDTRAEFDRFLARVRRDAEAELDSWMTRAYEAEKRAWKAEARIKAVQHLIDQADEMGEWAITCTRLQWAVDGSNPRPAHDHTSAPNRY